MSKIDAMPWVYLSGPYSSDPCATTHRMCQLWRRLHNRYGSLVLLICPHWSHFQNTMSPMPYESWIDYDLNVIRVLARSGPGVVYRVGGESKGADREVALARELGVRVIGSEMGLAQWIALRVSFDPAMTPILHPGQSTSPNPDLSQMAEMAEEARESGDRAALLRYLRARRKR